MSYLMCAFPYLPFSVLVMPTSVFLASSVVISCMMATLSALCLDPFALAFVVPFLVRSR
jgi:hypothetical protein